jgi:hypothetical protein
VLFRERGQGVTHRREDHRPHIHLQELQSKTTFENSFRVRQVCKME